MQSAPKRVLANSLSWDERLTLCAPCLCAVQLVLASKRGMLRTELLQLLWQLFAEVPQVSLSRRGRAACSPAELVTLFLSSAYIRHLCLLCHNGHWYAHLVVRCLPAFAEGTSEGAPELRLLRGE